MCIRDSIKSGPTDANGILMVTYGKEFVGNAHAGAHYNPYSIATAVLSFARFRSDPKAVASIRQYLDFLLAHAHKDNDGRPLHVYPFNYPSVDATAPWYSAMSQATAGSAFLWGHRVTGEQTYLDAAVESILALEGDTNPPFLIHRRNGLWPKEYPTWRYAVLDGALAALIGIWDLSRAMPMNDLRYPQVIALLEKTKDGVLDGLPCFASSAYGHFYADAGYSLGSSYQRTNIRLLTYLADLDPKFGDFAQAFSVSTRNPIIKAWYAAILTLRGYFENRGLIERSKRPCITASPNVPQGR